MREDASVAAQLAQARDLLKSRDLDGAARAYRDIVARHAASAQAWFMLGVVQAERREFAEASASIARSMALDPSDNPSRSLVYANVLMDAGDPRAAEAILLDVLRGVPRLAPAHAALGRALRAQGRLEEAISAHRAALDADPGYVRGQPALAEAHWAFARKLHRQAKVFDAIDEYRKALALDDGPADFWNDLGNAFADAALHGEAQRCYRETLRRNPRYHEVESSLLINIHYDPAFNAGAIFEAHLAWAERHAADVAPLPAPRRVAAPNEPLRVGFLSPAFRSGPTGSFFSPLLRHLDRGRFETWCYDVGGAPDATTQRLRAMAGSWREASTLSDEALARAIRDDHIDILVDLAGHAPGGRLLALARKPAPVIATWLDYFDTTGLEAVDFLLGDSVSTPQGGPQRFTEELVILGPSRLCYAPSEDAPEVMAPPALRNGFVTFGSFNRASKMAQPVIALWAEVLEAVPGSRLLLKNGAFVDARMRERLAELFVREGIAAERVQMRPYSTHAQMLAEYGDVDIGLDPFPYNGGLTTCEALWMGVPVLALLGDSLISRQGASLLEAASLGEWIAPAPRDFVRIAAERAAQLDGLEAMRPRMREMLERSVLLDGPDFARRFESALLTMWARR